MSGLCGWFDMSGPDARGGTDISTMAGELARFDATPLRIKSTAWAAVATAGRVSTTDVFQDTEQLAAIVGTARFTDPELSKLAQQRGLCAALARGYRLHGAELLQRIAGSFALAILDRRDDRALLAIDRIGTRTLCYTIAANKLLFASTLDALNAGSRSSPEVSHQGIYDYVYFHMVPGPQTIYAECRRLLPGTFLTWNRGSGHTSTYWKASFSEDEKPPFEELKRGFLQVVRDSVAEAAKGGGCGAFLSGGTDSSTVAGMLREVTAEAPRTYSIGFDAKGYDEMRYARIAARHFATRHREYYVTPDDVANVIPQIAALHDQPFGNSSAVPTYYCARMAKEDGTRVLLAGDGGDELFGGNARYATQYVYSLYSDLPRAVRKTIVEPLISMLPTAGLTGKAQRYIATASTPMPARYDNYNLLERLGAASIFTADFLRTIEISLPAAQLAKTYEATQAQSLINRMLALDLKYTLADNDLIKVSRSCELGGVDVRFPLLTEAVVDFAARLAPDLKLRGPRLRYFFKRALRDFLPKEIIKKTKHGFGLPFGPWLQSNQRLREIAFDSLNNLKKRHIVRPSFIDELTTVHLEAHAGYYGTMVWLLMMLEQWLQQRRLSRSENGGRTCGSTIHTVH